MSRLGQRGAFCQGVKPGPRSPSLAPEASSVLVTQLRADTTCAGLSPGGGGAEPVTPGGGICGYGGHLAVWVAGPWASPAEGCCSHCCLQPLPALPPCEGQLTVTLYTSSGGTRCPLLAPGGRAGGPLSSCGPSSPLPPQPCPAQAPASSLLGQQAQAPGLPKPPGGSWCTC